MNFENHDQFKLFEHGSISIVGQDDEKREVALVICMPCCVLQAIFPTISGNSIINNYSIKNPVSIWVPTLSPDKFNSSVFSHRGFPQNINEKLRVTVQGALDTFLEIANFINNPVEILSILPLGTYVIFQLRLKIDDLAKILMDLENVELPGVPDFRYALASVLAKIVS
jgi:hypothetical protein